MRYLYLQYGNVGLIDVNLAVNRIWIMIITGYDVVKQVKGKAFRGKVAAQIIVSAGSGAEWAISALGTSIYGSSAFYNSECWYIFN